MQLAMIGLGKMGLNMTKRLAQAGHELFVFDLSPDHVQQAVNAGAHALHSVSEIQTLMAGPRFIWMMLPSGEVTENTVQTLGKILQKGDTLVDGGNSYFKDDVRRSQELRGVGIRYMDVGTSGGIWGFENGYCLMVGGETDAFRGLEPVLKSLSPGSGSSSGQVIATPGRKSGTAEQGYIHCGPVGSGHFVKMIHNGIEYGMMQSFAEGFDILKNANSEALPEALRYNLNLNEISEVWRRGSVVSSWLLDLVARSFNGDPELLEFEGFVQDSGEGRWTLQAAIDESVSADVLASALFTRFRSRKTHSFAEKVLSAMRYQFGGHLEKSARDVDKAS